MYGMIDIGSNAMRLACYEVVEDGLEQVYHDRRVAGLAGYVVDGCLSEAGIHKAIAVIRDFQTALQTMELRELYAIATASFRNVENTEEILQTIEAETGIRVRVLSGEEEAECGFAGATYGMQIQECIMTDLGGGSTEVVFYQDGKITEAFSMPVGCLKMYKEFVSDVLPNDEEAVDIREMVRQNLEQGGVHEHVAYMVAVGGTSRALCNLYNDAKQIDTKNRTMDCEQIALLVDSCMNHQNELRQKIFELEPDRIHTMLPGMLALDEINQYYACEKMHVSPWGVREGYLMKMLEM